MGRRGKTIKSLLYSVLILIVFSVLAICFSGTAAASSVLYGDVNGDGKINSADAVLILRHIVGLENIRDAYGDNGVRRAKVSIGRTINISDAVYVLRRTVGLNSTFPIEETRITGKAQVTIEQAQQWVKNRGKDRYDKRFIDIAPLYWDYGEKTGIRPEILYAQSAKETNFGKYTGIVKPEQNNWAGIKIGEPHAGEKPEDHETFDTPEDGVRAHFNHMCAYIGKKPVGEPHDRYYLVITISWAGTIRYVEELGGRWAPNPAYGESIVKDYLKGMLAVK